MFMWSCDINMLQRKIQIIVRDQIKKIEFFSRIFLEGPLDQKKKKKNVDLLKISLEKNSEL